jgi:hypothetical protein
VSSISSPIFIDDGWNSFIHGLLSVDGWNSFIDGLLSVDGWIHSLMDGIYSLMAC